MPPAGQGNPFGGESNNVFHHDDSTSTTYEFSIQDGAVRGDSLCRRGEQLLVMVGDTGARTSDLQLVELAL